MRYFNKFPLLEYDFSIGAEDAKPIVITDTMVRLRAIINQEYDLDRILMDYYMIDGDTLEVVSHKVYGKSEYHWTIPFVNEKYNYITDYPLNTVQLDQYVKDKYTITRMDDVHHWEDHDGDIISGFMSQSGSWISDKYMKDGVMTNGLSVSNREYEIRVNEAKRKIKVIMPEYIAPFVSKFREKLLSIKEGVSV